MEKQEKMYFSTEKQDEMDFLTPLNFYSFFQQKKITYVPLKHGVLVWGIYTTNHIPFEHKRLVITKNDLFSKSRHFLAQFHKNQTKISTNSI